MQQNKPKMFICLDPGLSRFPGGTGWALFNSISTHIVPVETGLITTRVVKLSWEERVSEICKRVHHDLVPKLRWCGVVHGKVYIELPTLFLSAKGMTCASGKNGGDSDLVKLAFLVGSLSEIFREFDIPVQLIRVNDWKVQLNDKQVEDRVENRLGVLKGQLPYSIHETCAVAMGLWVKGSFKANEGRIQNTGTRATKGKEITEIFNTITNVRTRKRVE